MFNPFGRNQAESSPVIILKPEVILADARKIEKLEHSYDFQQLLHEYNSLQSGDNIRAHNDVQIRTAKLRKISDVLTALQIHLDPSEESIGDFIKLYQKQEMPSDTSWQKAA